MARTKTKPHVKAFAEKQVKKKKKKKKIDEKKTHMRTTHQIHILGQGVGIHRRQTEMLKHRSSF